MNKTFTNRRNWVKTLGITLAGLGLVNSRISAILASDKYKKTSGKLPVQTIKTENNMKLGALSISLNVKDINASKQFYENLGFKVFGGDITQNWLIMKNGNSIVGLFQGMFEKNMLTFNPGWDQNASKLENYDDVREIQKRLKEKGIKLQMEADEKTTGPASFIVIDPDGNPVLFDQHI